jgi:hypothetical protein
MLMVGLYVLSGGLVELDAFEGKERKELGLRYYMFGGQRLLSIRWQPAMVVSTTDI